MLSSCNLHQAQPFILKTLFPSYLKQQKGMRMISPSNGFIFLIQTCRASAELQEGHLPSQGKALGRRRAPPFSPSSLLLFPPLPPFPPSHGMTPSSALGPLRDSHNDICPPCSPWTLHLASRALLKAICPRLLGTGDACLGTGGHSHPFHSKYGFIPGKGAWLPGLQV